MESGLSGRLVGSEIHGFHTLQDLDIHSIMEESRTRWLRPNEIHAMLCNHKYFTINVKPVNLPSSGTIVLFDRKMLRNFRKDGHNWKKKKDGKTVKEAHEHLKVGNEERIHVYYAHGEDNPTFVRRCYWLLDKTLEHIVLVHYRETQELQGSPVTPVNSNSSSASDQAAALLLSEELDSGAAHSYYSESNDSLSIRNHEMRLHEINTLEWEELVANNPNSIAPGGGNNASFGQQNLTTVDGAVKNGSALPGYNVASEVSALGDLTVPNVGSGATNFNIMDSFYNQSTDVQSNSHVQGKDSGALGTGASLDILLNDGLQSQDSFGRWINSVIADSPSSDDSMLNKSSVSSGQDSLASPEIGQHQSSSPEPIFTITDFSPAWAFSTETTKVLVTGYFHDQYPNLTKSSVFCICGDTSVPAQTVQTGVYSCMVPPHPPGLVKFCLSLDGHNPISQILNFEYHTPLLHDHMVSSEDKSNWEEFKLQMRLAFLLCTRSKTLNVITSKVSPTNLKEARKFAQKTSHISSSWVYLIKGIEENKFSYSQAKDGLFELALKNMLKEWLLERVLEGGKSTEYDGQGLGVIHLCAILGYTWAVHMFSWSGLSLDFRDKHGWTALHWAAFHGREKMVAVLLSVGAKPNLVSDPSPQNPGGCTAADLASANGFDGLAAYLSEKALVAHFEAMSIAGNVSGSLQTGTSDTASSNNLSQEELYLKETLAAYRTAADAAARIHVAFREHAFKVRSKAVEAQNPEDEARSIIAAMKIQNAFRNFDTRKKMAAAVRIQYRFRTWKMRKEFLNTRKQVIKIQSAFRGFQVRRQYRKIIWSVGVVEKAILRWRLKRRGFRGLKVDAVESVVDQKQESDVVEDFYKTSQQQAEERVERCVVRVQALFRSKKAQEEYQSMKLAHTQATMEYKELLDADNHMDR